MKIFTAVCRHRFAYCYVALCGLTLLIAACDRKTEMALVEYQRFTQSVLARDSLSGVSLWEILSVTIGDLGCDDDLCTALIRFQYLNDEIPPRQALVADFIGKLCKNEEKMPPATLADQHRNLCRQLETLFSALDAILIHSQTALSLETSNAQTTSEPLRREISNRLAQQRQVIVSVQEAFDNLDWIHAP